jgi:MoxR-like ATPase
MRAPAVAEPLARQVAGAVERLRAMGLYKPPGVAETIDWAEALAALGRRGLDERTVELTLGSVLKYREDAERVRSAGLGDLVRAAVQRAG